MAGLEGWLGRAGGGWRAPGLRGGGQGEGGSPEQVGAGWCGGISLCCPLSLPPAATVVQWAMIRCGLFPLPQSSDRDSWFIMVPGAKTLMD